MRRLLICAANMGSAMEPISNRRSKHCGTEAAETKKLKAPEAGNARLKGLRVEQMKDVSMPKETLKCDLAAEQ